MAGRVTLADRCLVYLLDRADVGPDHPAAADLLQERIAESMADQRAHVSRAMGKLARANLVRTGKIHARGERRRRVAYFLTDAGRRRARELRQRLEEVPVTVVDLEGRESVRRLYEVPALLPRPPRFSDLLAAVRRGRLDLGRVVDRQARLHRGRLYDVRGVLASAHFRGRDDALARLDAFLRDPRADVLLLLGLPGIGKTALASRWVDAQKGRLHVFWRRLGPETTAAEVCRDLAAMLQSAGRPALWERLHRPPEGGPGDLRQVLRRDLSGLRLVLVFDDVHLAKGDVAALLGDLVHGDVLGGAKVLLLAREPPSFLPTEGIARGRVWRETLDDLSEGEARAVLAAMGVDPDRRAAIVARCGGHPLSLELAARGGTSIETVRRTSAAWLAEAVVSRLGAADRSTLALAAVYGEPVLVDLLGPRADRLLVRSLLREAEDGRVGVHDMLRDAVLQDLPPRRLADLHRKAGAALATARGPREGLAAIRHLLAAGASGEAAALVVARGEELVASGLAPGLLPAFEALRRTSSEPRLQLLEGHALSAMGRWREAAAAYERCARSEEPYLAAEATLGQGKAEQQRRSRLAISLLTSARDRLERLGALRLLSEAQYWIGVIHEDAHRLDEAMDAFERGRAIAADVGDRRWEGLCAYGTGRIRSLRGDYTGAIEEEKEALRLLERQGLPLEIAKVCAGLGGNLIEIGDLDSAETYLRRAAEASRSAGATGILAATLYNLASVRKKRGRAGDAIPLLEEASGLYEAQEQYDWAARCEGWLGACSASVGKREEADRAFARAASFLARAREPALRVWALRHLARAEREAGRPGDARRDFRKAMTEARANDLGLLVAELSAERKRFA